MRNPNIEHNIVTVTLPTPKGDFLRTLLALTHQSKNLYNTGLFLIRQVYSAYEYDRVDKTSHLKSTLHPSQTQAIEHFNAQVERINKARRQNYGKKLAKDPDAELDQVPSLDPSANPTRTILDSAILDNAARWWTDANNERIYKSLPGVMAQQVLRDLTDNFGNFFAATKKYNTAPAGMTGRPRMPKYLPKHDRRVLEIPLAAVHNGKLPTLKRKTIAEDYLKQSILPKEVLAAFTAFDVNQAVSNACDKRGWASYTPRCLRIVPCRRGIKLEVVVHVQGAYPKNSFLANLNATHGSELAAIKKSEDRDKWLLQFLKTTPFENLPRIAAADLGANNLATIAFSTGHKAHVHSSGRFEAVVGAFNDQLEKFVSKHTPPRARELQDKKNALQKTNEKLSKAEHIELNTLLKVIYTHTEYRKIADKRQRWISDFLHKTSRSIVKDAVDKKIDVIVIGQNIGWKQESNMGRVQNRRFCQIAHATLIKLISYKAEHHGIAVVLTEESYTSQNSFITNEAMEVYNKETHDDPTRVRPVKDGYRRSDDRKWFVHKQKRNDRWKIVHADVNGAFNIIRKVFENFKYHVGLTLKFTVFRLSPRLGTVRIFS
jgi:putative transposase